MGSGEHSRADLAANSGQQMSWVAKSGWGPSEPSILPINLIGPGLDLLTAYYDGFDLEVVGFAEHGGKRRLEVGFLGHLHSPRVRHARPIFTMQHVLPARLTSRPTTRPPA